MRNVIVYCALLCVLVTSASAQPSTGTRIWDGSRAVIAGGVGTGVAVYSISTAFTHQPLEAIGLNAVGLGAYTLPNTMMLLGLYQGNPERVRFWRRTAAITQTAQAALFAGIGAYALVSNNTGDLGSLAGPVYMIASIPLFGIAALHFSPYYMEF